MGCESSGPLRTRYVRQFGKVSWKVKAFAAILMVIRERAC